MKTPGGFIDLPDSALAAHQIATDDVIIKIAENVNFAIDRCEIIYMGFYKNGDTVPTPVSPVDGYQYSRSEVMYDWQLFATGAADNIFESGQADAPTAGEGISTKPQAADIYHWVADIDDSTGKVSTYFSFFAQGKVSETGTNDGIVKVFAVCQRASVNIAS
jgi:hypothetical protein